VYKTRRRFGLVTRWMQEREEEATSNEGDAFLAVGRYIKA
jgi:hypothetical protein